MANKKEEGPRHRGMTMVEALAQIEKIKPKPRVEPQRDSKPVPSKGRR